MTAILSPHHLMLEGMDLMMIADSIGVTVRRAHTVTGALGEYDHTERTIRLHPGLSGVRCTAVLAHEIGHAVYGHTSSTPVSEREADYFAHWLLVCPRRFLTACRVYRTVQGVAYDLEVTPSMVASYASRWWPDGGEGVAVG
ncbi:hypothetical protein FHX35_000174 [Auritidibacter ignavus]|nr:hypothetical protein [Auritidibacter ignavus]